MAYANDEAAMSATHKTTVTVDDKYLLEQRLRNSGARRPRVPKEKLQSSFYM